MAAYKIYISSTYRDLIEDRALLRLKLDQAQYATICMETYPPALSKLIKTKCEDDVRDCDIYICIVGDSYGSLAKDEAGNELAHSYTEYEYDAAVLHKKKRLVFFKQLDKETDDPRLKNFIQKIRQSAYLTGSFREIHQLPTDVLVSIIAETGDNKKRMFSPDLKYFCDRSEHTNAFDTIFFQQKKASAKIHFFLLPGHEFNGHRAFIERYKCRFKAINNGEEPIDISFNIKTDGVIDETKIKELIKEQIKRGIKDRFETESLPDVKANHLFEQLNRVRKKILFVIMNVQSTYIKESFADLYKASIEKFYNEFTVEDDPAYQDKRIIFFMNLKYSDDPKNLDVLNRTFNDNPFYADKKLPGLDNINTDDITEWLEFHNIEKTPLLAKKLIQKQITQIEDADYEELSSDGIFMDEAELLMDAIIQQYNLKKNNMFDLKDIRTAADSDPKHYLITDEGLKKAVDMAIWLQKPLLLTGAPGTGKTQLASKVAYELSLLNAETLNGFAPFHKKPFGFYTKTTSSASDLFYTYDAIGHFQKRHIDSANNGNAASSAHPYIQLNALGKAILQTYGKRKILAEAAMSEFQQFANFNELSDEPQSSVVLIDEIDKAPRDFPNDLLNEIEHYRFTINELNKSVEKADAQVSNARIVVIMTSNFEKNLPDAFLRRCLFYHIPSPDASKLYEIVCSRMEPYLQIVYKKGSRPRTDDEIKTLITDIKPKFDAAIKQGFERARNNMVDKQPSTSELLEWIKVLEAEGFFQGALDFGNLTVQQKTILKYTLPIIAKTKDDLENAAK